jgi:hypothetical protein
VRPWPTRPASPNGGKALWPVDAFSDRLVPELRAPALLSAIADCAEELERGAILTIDWSDQVRARLLPLR